MPGYDGDAAPTDGPHPLEDLCRIVDLVPIPPARPAYERFDEAAGLTLLELSLRMEHLHRLSESLTFVDSTHMRRSVSVDVDLRMVSARQRLAVRARPIGPWPEVGGDGPAQIWVPIARQSRGDLASVEIRDQSGALVPRLTSAAVRRALIAGLARFVKGQILASGGLPGDRYLQARWLIERAVAHSVDLGSPDAWSRLRQYDAAAAGPGADPVAAVDPAHGAPTPAQIRERAVSWLRGGADPAARAVRQQFAELLRIASDQQLLVVLLSTDRAHEHVHLHFDAPPVPVRPGPERLSLRLRGWLPLNREYRVEYETLVPRRAHSYHVAVEVPEEIKVRRFLLSSDTHEVTVQSLARELEHLAGAAAVLVGSGARDAAVAQVRRAELIDALARVASLSRLRNADLVAYRGYMDKAFAALGGRLPDAALEAWRRGESARAVAGARLLAGHPQASAEQIRCAGLVAEVIAEQASLAGLGALALQHERGRLLDVLTLLDADQLAGFLRQLAHYLVFADLGLDIAVDNDPRENGAHAHWNRPELRFGPRLTEPVGVRFTLALADEPPALAETVALMVGCLLVVVGVLAVVVPRAGSDAGLNQADAIVAVLLLVPTILLSRLDVASKRTVLGDLRVLPRRIAYAAVVATGSLALVAAGDGPHFAVAAWIVFGVLGLLLAGAGAEIVGRTFGRRRLVPRSRVAPHWLLEAMTGVRLKEPPEPADAEFDAIGTVRSTTARQEQVFWLRLTQIILRAKQLGRPALQRWRAFLRYLNRAAARPRVPAKPWPAPMPWPRRRSGPTTRPAEAVSRAARSAADRRTAVEAVVSHLGEVPSGHAPAGGHGSTDDCAAMTELLSFTTLGTTVEVRTRLVSDPGALVTASDPAARGRSVLSVTPVPVPDPRRHVVRALLRPGSPVVGPGSQHNEILLALGPPRELSAQQARMIVFVLHELTWLMTRHAALPVHITFPAAEPAAGANVAERRRGASAPFMRLALSNAQGLAAGRMAFEEDVIAAAQHLGLGVWLSQGRASSDVAQWGLVAPFDRDRFLAARAERFPLVEPPRDGPDHLEMATFALPADQGVPRALAELACRAYRDGLGVHSLTSWALQQTVFVTAAFRSRRASMPPPADAGPVVLLDGVPSPWFEAWGPRPPRETAGGPSYRRLVDRAALDAGQSCGCERPGSVAQRVLGAARQSATVEPMAELVAASRTVLVPRALDEQHPVVPFWVSWRVPERTDVDLVTDGLVSAFRRYNDGRDAWVTFLRARHDDRDHMRGRAKVAVPVPAAWGPRHLGTLAQTVQEEVRAALDAAFPGRGAAVSFQVAWGERWLDGSR